MTERLVGYVSHYFRRIEVAAIDLVDTLEVGDTIHVWGSTTDFEQEVVSMQEDHGPIQVAEKGHSVGVKVTERVRNGDKVYVTSKED
jgi:translation elongation factor EF-1alpha